MKAFILLSLTSLLAVCSALPQGAGTGAGTGTATRTTTTTAGTTTLTSTPTATSTITQTTSTSQQLSSTGTTTGPRSQNTTISSTSSTSSPSSPISGTSILRPSSQSLYDVWTGEVHYASKVGRVFKNGRTTDVTTLLTFDLPSSLQGKTCEFHFYLDSSATLWGTATFDVYTALAPATKDSASWPSGNLRDQYAGRMKAVSPGEATFLLDYSDPAYVFDCPYGLKMGAELVGTGDQDQVEWSLASSGAYIVYY